MKKIISLIFLLATFTANAQKVWTLDECISYAKEHNINVKIQSIAEQNQQIKLNSAKNQRLPNLSANLNQSFSFGRGISPADNSYQSVNSSSSSFGVSTGIPLFTGFQIPNQIAAEKLNLKAAVADLDKSLDDLEISVISAYLQILYNKDLLAISKSQSELSKEQLVRIQNLFDTGKASEAQIYEVKAQVANDEVSIVQAENNLEISKLTLSQLLELDSPEGFDIEIPENDADFLLPSNVENIYDNAFTTLSSIKADEYRLESSKKNVKIARSGYFPQLSVGAGYNNSYYRVNGRDNRSFSDQIKNNEGKFFGFYLTIPIFNRFTTRNNIRAAKLDVKTRELQLENTQKTLRKEIQQSYYNALGAKTKYNSAQTALKSTEKSYYFTKEKFENGRASSYEFNEAKIALKKAETTLSQAKYEYVFRKKIIDFYNGVRLGKNPNR